MTLSPESVWPTYTRAAARVCLEAWAAIQPFYFGQACDVVDKPDGPCTEADRLADRLIVEQLSRKFPRSEYGYLTEESEDDRERLERDRVWIIDPIDGTKDFIARRDNFCIQVGLAERLADGQWHPVAAAVYQPVAGQLWTATRGGGAFVQPVPFDPSHWANGRIPAPVGEPAPIHVTPIDRLDQARSVVSNANRSSRLMALIHSLELADYWHTGSLGVKVCTIANGDAELYVNLGVGKTKEWDTAAPALILTEAGGRLTDFDGNTWTYNQEDVVHRHGLLATNGAIHELTRARVKAFLEEHPTPYW
ncbi:MAG TPA: 3'(2'),5'-bisphosphate nucleotidase CysQ [Candidatus Sumerlaeota bacterium]|nr:MAG: 3'-phosphoadenosine 5'-phosphate phosphatase [candidate division BRC1 bacterium ADurb.BinA292]HOE97447.1 3'(2'),5'-bisphosphate nucleotidase CysQ [Candidatus Sumerlaeota bacterium]HOR27832.1 3'(2'),5'-bisphosphate nucleotidase CysQ [Candidatus Sumerlaeota bacterium]HPK03354.1 3'(2'),5'-bisphosphate nucleotidase CysQ [Candidatus Sumerlaeota bacterium]